MVPGHLVTRIIQCTIGPILWSDHAPTTLTLQNAFPHRGTPRRLNDSLLQDASFITHLTKDLEDYFTLNENQDISPLSLWKAHKPTIRLISRASFLKRKAQSDYLGLLRLLSDAMNAHAIQPADRHLHTIADTTKCINEIHLAKTAHILKRLKMTSYSQGNKAGKTLATMLRKKQTQSKIPYLITNTNKKTIQPQDISDEMANFYHAL
ncbi:reverse transcriptase [Pelobates cultripes]|uniref:Reverse transcriptase n=1 Tax=Pelobates cultripes TaxID=61616 RepID=A0AAD1SMK5_PELCU|nr:reverse transcriptase [Pelobates cultripes]